MNDWPEKFPKTSALLRQGMEAGLHIGGQLYVSRNGRPETDLAFGEARPGEPMQPGTLMVWASSTKPVTAIALAREHEKGRIGLDDPVVRTIPEFAQGGKGAITIRHMLTHTAGFRPADKVSEELGWEAKTAAISAAPAEEGWIAGEKAGYQTWSSWHILAEIVRRVDGRPFGQYVREELFLPLGMNDSWIGLPREQFEAYGRRMGVMHVTEKSRPAPHPVWEKEEMAIACRPGSNGRGPARELGSFYEALLPGGARGGFQMLRPDTIALFTARHRQGMFDHTFLHRLDWGLGFMVNSNCHGPETVPYGFGRHASDRAFGHSGSQSSAGFADPAHGLAVAWVLNGMPGERAHQKRARELNSAIYEDLGLA